MANVPVLFLLLFILSGAVGAQLQQSNMIALGSSLSPSTQPNSWLSRSRLFAFGFYPQGSGFAIGIWLASKPAITVVWSANRDDAPVSSNATLEFTRGGLLFHNNQGEENIIDLQEPAFSASILDSGNFVIYNNESRVIWESFHFPTDTILGGQNLSNGHKLLSSVSTSNHSSGRFYLIMQADGNLVAYPVNSSAQPGDAYWSTQTFDGGLVLLSLNRRGLLCLRRSGLNVDTLARSSYSDKDKMIIFRATLDADGNFRLYAHSFEISNNSTGLIKWSALQNQCKAKGFCGVNSYCSSTAATADCFCFPGFVFLNPNMKSLGCYLSFIDEESCRRKEPTLFYNLTALENVEWGGYPYSVILMNKEDCSLSCLEDCNCWAALYMGGTCSKHKLPLIYGVLNRNDSATAFFKIQISRVADVSSFFIYRRRLSRYKKLSEDAHLSLNGEFTLRSFSYSELEKVTDGFKEELGRNSFGAVYKGAISEGGKLVAVKRLERVVEEGESGFRAEITTIGQTHHRNLVRLLGFCIEGTRKLLVYEFINKGSLADLLFKVERRPSWRERVRIALEVARGILYLHEECEARIIHCNIKPQHILMDDSWTPKISDFGLAKLLMPNQNGTLTSLRRTGGYSAPEWHKNTLITEKADVYSFGVVLLEIVCCRSNMEVNVSTADEVLLSNWVYKRFVTRELEKLVRDEVVDISTLERMVKVGLLCIQDDPNLRPSMKNVILMLEGTMDIPIPPSP
ncbi:hypothetical protein F0562_005730 [Nyssa sinensis]|uniref:Receptor-like serine/threonine-protein kinase n=1 Tax=Nyssa sinensis TaxID=561372 RepID=A0A5J5AMM1_9ASTE|nr:hypothetical protein F0562_005730 [Nyssa sinensis]